MKLPTFRLLVLMKSFEEADGYLQSLKAEKVIDDSQYDSQYKWMNEQKKVFDAGLNNHALSETAPMEAAMCNSGVSEQPLACMPEEQRAPNGNETVNYEDNLCLEQNCQLSNPDSL